MIFAPVLLVSLRSMPNLKSTSDPAPVDDTVLSQLRDALGDRPVWIASSTHPGEEQIVLAAHRQLLADHPDLCLLLVPRHPQRGDEVAQLITDQGLTHARRSAGQLPGDADQVYLADTLGETGTWYALSPLVFLGGSLMPIGGHNPFEPALARAAVLTGPHTTNFVETFPPLIAAGGAVEVADAPGLAAGIGLWLDQPDQLQATRDAAFGFVQAQQSALDAVIETLCTRLALEPQDA